MQIEDSWVLATLMENTADSIYIKDRQCRLWRISKKMAMSLQIADPAEVYGKTDVELFGKEFGEKTMQDDLQVMESGQPIIGLIERYINKEGETNWTSTTKFPLRNTQGEIIGLMGITREINELKDSEIEYKWLATHDPLTALANRYLLSDRIEQAIFRAKRNKGLFALLFIDLNGFKQVNDTAGHAAGDQFLIRLARILSENVRMTDTVARIGGDEFVVLLDEIHQVEAAGMVAEKLSRIIYDDTDPQGHTVTGAIGISLFPNNGQDSETLLKAADQAMFQSKKDSLNYKFA
ncbi:MAG: GGDEF domain-containing protein [Anaerolineaceae bacterium]|nr:GGDEF domain-containing protein [Anaerolineaceae bacterium]